MSNKLSFIPFDALTKTKSLCDISNNSYNDGGEILIGDNIIGAAITNNDGDTRTDLGSSGLNLIVIPNDGSAVKTKVETRMAPSSGSKSGVA